ncbi:elongation factor P maturation arginine rhamnosyltransferase EarP, partial [Salmonella sp. s58676]|uniref:elongation factor P maturation arginine rhamnosyltransferase EarP n=1 Tax=Salmonella sp. s58676 TaxID=3159705 RepID=UPI00397EB507
EDSQVRAVWAGRPLLWHIYPQDDAAHLEKLQAWLACGSLPPAVQEAFMAWNQDTPPQPAANPDAMHSWANLLNGPAWQAWKQHARHDSDTQARQPDLGQQLVAFCQGKLPSP